MSVQIWTGTGMERTRNQWSLVPQGISKTGFGGLVWIGPLDGEVLMLDIL